MSTCLPDNPDAYAALAGWNRLNLTRLRAPMGAHTQAFPFILSRSTGCAPCPPTRLRSMLHGSQ